ncbi:GyrI-like domain-containing protein [Methanoregula sp.]|uniref:GyrI-like domain-containing protein n=1 Tax=Methanoregula sp. TaxID=2052170 RepID=UPI002CCB7AEF|nr:GyrI-like domain-containing protein [Methanoregula sp.]HVP97522.1 GyrI-like domain-containing protein [Methanoregula sp.]
MEAPPYTTVRLPARTVIGIERRTCNADGRSVTDIPACWKEFLTTNAAARIPHRIIPPVMYAVYSGYASDWTGEYSYLLGCGVVKAGTPPKGLAVRQIPAQTYAYFPARGRMPDAVVNIWAGIWGTDLPRTYTCDFEVYDSRFTDKKKPQVDIYVGIRDP